MTARTTKPKHAITIRTYEELEQFAAAFAAGHLNLLILVGPPGVAKSQTIRQVVGNKACWIEGNATAFGVFQALWQNRDKPVVIDDVDSLYADRSAVRLLKCVCQTDPVKRVAWHSASNSLTGEGIPRQFETTSRSVIITNEWKELDSNVSAVQDRGHLVIFEPTPAEIHLKVAEWFSDEVVFEWFTEHLHLVPNLSMRHYVRAAELKQAGIDWVKVLLSDSVPEKALLIAKLKADPKYREERERVRAFRELGGGGQTTWYKWSRRMKAPKDIEVLRQRVAGIRARAA